MEMTLKKANIGGPHERSLCGEKQTEAEKPRYTTKTPYTHVSEKATSVGQRTKDGKQCDGDDGGYFVLWELLLPARSSVTGASCYGNQSTTPTPTKCVGKGGRAKSRGKRWRRAGGWQHEGMRRGKSK